jgi:hypothetical protein
MVDAKGKEPQSGKPKGKIYFVKIPKHSGGNRYHFVLTCDKMAHCEFCDVMDSSRRSSLLSECRASLRYLR